eukprot:3513802-Pleurochrysis_carterae.AAC.1
MGRNICAEWGEWGRAQYLGRMGRKGRNIWVECGVGGLLEQQECCSVDTRWAGRERPCRHSPSACRHGPFSVARAVGLLLHHLAPRPYLSGATFYPLKRLCVQHLTPRPSPLGTCLRRACESLRPRARRHVLTPARLSHCHPPLLGRALSLDRIRGWLGCPTIF